MNQQNLVSKISMLAMLLCLFLFLVITEAKFHETCKSTRTLAGKKPPKGKCNKDHDSDCCKEGKHYPAFECLPPVSARTKAILTLNGFSVGKDGGGPSECDGLFHSDRQPVVALSTGCFQKKRRCSSFITIHGNGRRVRAMVVDECDSSKGCDAEHDFQPLCRNNVVDVSPAVWKALKVPEKDWGEMEIFWSPA